MEQEMIANEDFPNEGSFDAEDVEDTYEDAPSNCDESISEEAQEKSGEVFSIQELPDSFEKINKIATILKNYP
jgi:hypothetical protein